MVKLQGPGDPMVDLRIGGRLVGDTVVANSPALEVTVTGGVGSKLVVFKDGVELKSADVTADPFELADLAQAGRFRAEVQIAGQPRTVTGNLWVETPVEPPPKTGCGCSSGGELVLLAALMLLRSLAPKGGEGRGEG